jgi:pimeloyl-ACP methyl ester carboxylesterase
MDRLFAILAIAAALAGCTAGADPPTAAQGAARVEAIALDVEGQTAQGLVGIPASEPTTLVVFAHPWSTPAETYRDALLGFAQQGVLGVAMDFRGEVQDFKVNAGVQDTVAATLALQGGHPTIDRTLLYGYSMGGEVSFLAVAAAPPGTYDYVFDGAGVTDLAALWRSFVAARPAIEKETGGTPTDVPGAYSQRSPVEQVAGLADKGVARYFIVHGAGDAPVPVEQAERLYSRMADAGLPVSYYVVTTNHDPWVCTPVVTVCVQGPPKGVANHEAGSLRLLLPLLQHRIDRLPDPAPGAVRGTYDGDTGAYEPSDVG